MEEDKANRDHENLTRIVVIQTDNGEVGLAKSSLQSDPYVAYYMQGQMKRSNQQAATQTITIRSEQLEQARLAFGLLLGMKKTVSQDTFQQIGDFTGYEIPAPIAVAGKDHIATYLKFVEDSVDESNTRSTISRLMGISKQTVSNYFNRVRWDGCLSCGSENIEKKTLRVDADEVDIAECFNCGSYHVVHEDRTKQNHPPISEEHRPEKVGVGDQCGTELEPAVGKHGTDEFRLWCCMACGFFTAEPQRHQTGE